MVLFAKSNFISIFPKNSPHKKLLIQQSKKVKKTQGGFYHDSYYPSKTDISRIKKCTSSFETFALGTDNQQAKQLYQNAAKQTQSVIDSLEPRIQQIEQEEPQYNQL